MLHEAYGARGGIAQFNRDFIEAAVTEPGNAEIVGVPLRAIEAPGPVPDGLIWLTRGIGSRLRFLVTVARAAMRGQYDLVLCGHLRLLPAAWLARAVCCLRGRRIPMALIVHGIDAWDPPTRLAPWLVRGVDCVLSVSAYTRDRMRSWARLEERRFEILSNCADTERFRPGPPDPSLAARYGITGRPVLLTVSQLDARDRYKGIDEVMEALPALRSAFPDLVYVVAGEGTDRERLEQKAAGLGASGRVVFTGYVPESDKPGLYRLADGFVLAGSGEGFGIVLLEAMATGVPVLASTLDASREVVGDGLLGAVVDPRDPAALRDALAALLRRAKGVPDGLARYARPAFVARVQAALARCVAPAED